MIGQLLAGGPAALAAAKRLVYDVPGDGPRGRVHPDHRAVAQSLFASAEAAEGMAAFREKRPPSWAPPQRILTAAPPLGTSLTCSVPPLRKSFRRGVHLRRRASSWG